MRRAAPLRTAQHATIKSAGLVKVRYGESEVKWLHGEIVKPNSRLTAAALHVQVKTFHKRVALRIVQAVESKAYMQAR